MYGQGLLLGKAVAAPYLIEKILLCKRLALILN